MKNVSYGTKEILKQFQCDHIRTLEEIFAQMFSEREDVRLFFVNEDQAFTDGRNIIIDPAVFGIYADKNALIKTGQFLGWPPVVLSTAWNALQIITRAQNIHECLHILYTDFPCRSFKDPKCDTRNKRKVMSMISNIIEDAYIEAVGCSVYDNLEFYLKFMRVSQLFVSKKPKETVARSLKAELEANPDLVKTKKPKERTNADRIRDYLGLMGDYLLYPWVWDDKYVPDDLREYVDETKQLFDEGCTKEYPAERYEYTSRIFDLIAELIPDDETELHLETVVEKLPGSKTHMEENGPVGSEERFGRPQKVTRRLFVDLNGKKRNDKAPIDQLMTAVSEFASNKNATAKIVGYGGSYAVFTGANYDCAVLHEKIKINETRPQINTSLRRAYQNICSKYNSTIRSYGNRLQQLLQARMTVRDEKYKFGTGIVSSRLGDPQKRYWYRNIEGTDVPDMAVLLLVDGSGSMRGSRIQSAINSSVIIHEVLKKAGINHAIVEQRARFEKPEIDINILVGFGAQKDEKLNILQMYANGDNRDGLSLYWAERYIRKMTQNEYKLIIAISDGVPAHDYDNYYPPVSTKDTAAAVRKITKRGTHIVAVALNDDQSFDCYTMLSEIYPNLIACNDLNRLTSQLLGIITKLLKA